MSNEPFSGSTTNQQWGSAWGHVNRMKDDPALGPGAAAQYVYENFDKFKELADVLGQPMRDKLSWGAAMNTLTERPGAIEGLNLRDGKEKLYEMQEVLKTSVEMARDNRLDINAFVQGWSQKFGEALAPSDVTLQKLEEKLVWAMSNIQQLGHYEKSAKGQAEVSAYQQHVQQVTGLREAAEAQRAQYDAARAEVAPIYEQITQLRERSREIGQNSPTKGTPEYRSYWSSVGPEQDRLREEIKRLDELAKERQGRVDQLRNETKAAYDKFDASRQNAQLPSRAKDTGDDWFTK
jgi:DNA repair exonuclease SbcCD ATPase subunit